MQVKSHNWRAKRCDSWNYEDLLPDPDLGKTVKEKFLQDLLTIS